MVAATSHIPQDGSITYGPENTVDGDLQTAWNSDAPGTEGRGETLTYRFAEPVDLKAVRFVNGYVKNDDVFTANHRARDLVIRADNSAQPVMLLDTGDEQEVAFDFGLTSKVEIEVLDIYPGDGFDRPELTADLAITEVAFLALQP